MARLSQPATRDRRKKTSRDVHGSSVGPSTAPISRLRSLLRNKVDYRLTTAHLSVATSSRDQKLPAAVTHCTETVTARRPQVNNSAWPSLPARPSQNAGRTDGQSMSGLHAVAVIGLSNQK